jgi:hypothetical protein
MSLEASKLNRLLCYNNESECKFTFTCLTLLLSCTLFVNCIIVTKVVCVLLVDCIVIVDYKCCWLVICNHG